MSVQLQRAKSMLRLTRREFLWISAIGAAGMCAAPPTGMSPGTRELELAIVGLGQRGQRLMFEARSGGKARIASVCDADPGALRNGVRFGTSIDAGPIRRYRDLRSLLEGPAPEAVAVAIPDALTGTFASDRYLADRNVLFAPARTFDGVRGFAKASRAGAVDRSHAFVMAPAIRLAVLGPRDRIAIPELDRMEFARIKCLVPASAKSPLFESAFEEMAFAIGMLGVERVQDVETIAMRDEQSGRVIRASMRYRLSAREGRPARLAVDVVEASSMSARRSSIAFGSGANVSIFDVSVEQATGAIGAFVDLVRSPESESHLMSQSDARVLVDVVEAGLHAIAI